MRLALPVLLLLAACSPGNQSAENLPSAPGTTHPAATPAAPPPIDPAMANLCAAMTPEEAAEAQKTLPDSGQVSSWTVRGGRDLICTEPATDGVVGCELAAGASFVIAKDGTVAGYRNTTGKALSVTIGPEGGMCRDLTIPPIAPR